MGSGMPRGTIEFLDQLRGPDEGSYFWTADLCLRVLHVPRGGCDGGYRTVLKIPTREYCGAARPWERRRRVLRRTHDLRVVYPEVEIYSAASLCPWFLLVFWHSCLRISCKTISAARPDGHPEVIS